ncbi:phosphoenolpyruvate carboxylase, partial [Arthrospira platensis SPKY1]|nr:phosphoenolpyruvate carboxylase [Arthrospira platensis SPKY1]
DMRLAHRYAGLCTDQELAEGVYGRIRDEFERTVAEVLLVGRLETLMDENPLLARSLGRRDPYLDPLNHIQVDLLRKSRAFENSANGTGEEENPWLPPLLRSI